MEPTLNSGSRHAKLEPEFQFQKPTPEPRTGSKPRNSEPKSRNQGSELEPKKTNLTPELELGTKHQNVTWIKEELGNQNTGTKKKKSSKTKTTRKAGVGKGKKRDLPTTQEQEQISVAYTALARKGFSLDAKPGLKITQALLAKEATLSKTKAAWWLNHSVELNMSKEGAV